MKSSDGDRHVWGNKLLYKNSMRFHTSSETVTCERHPLYAEDACKGCEIEKEEESQWLEKGLKDSKAGGSRTLTSQEITFAEVLRERQVAKCKAGGTYTDKLIGFAWANTKNPRMLQSYEEAGRNFDMMLL